MGRSGLAASATRAFAETYETRTGAEGDAQLETWVDDDNAFGGWDVWRVWWGGTVSLTDALELSIYAVGAQQREGSAVADGTPSSGIALEMIYLMARYRFFGKAADGFSAMLQLDYCLPALSTAPDQAAFDYLAHANVIGERLILSYVRGRLVSAVNLDFEEALLLDAEATGETVQGRVSYSAGVAAALEQPGPGGPPLTLGVEVFGDLPFARGGAGGLFWPGGFPVAVGPAASFARGRFWATASVGYAPGGAFSMNPPDTGGHARWNSNEAVGRLIVAFEL